MSGRTKEERFILKLYQAAIQTGDAQNPIDRYAIGQSAGLSPKSTDTMCRELARANFIRKAEPEGYIVLTSRGEELACTLIS
jgi:Mn-dependent DtxR family transcriptional regulator